MVVAVEVAVAVVEEVEGVALCSLDQGQDLRHHHPLHLLEDQAVGGYQDQVLLDSSRGLILQLTPGWR